MSIEDKFNAAVKVIRGLPKNGPYQPSTDMMLKFYANFKQATEGPCVGRRPAFWDVVGRAKYDSWKCLGELPREKAMERYVDELKKIVETMSYTENVANFMGNMSDLDNISVEDLELVAPEAIEKVRSRPNSPFHSRETSPVRGMSSFADDVSSEIQNKDNLVITTNGYSNSEEDSSDISDDEFIDTVEDDIPITPVEHYSRSREKKNYSQYNGAIPNTRPGANQDMITSLINLTNQMKLDMAQVNSRINLLENKIRSKRNYPNWWPFTDISPEWFAAGFLWPIFVVAFFRFMQRRREALIR